MDIEESLRKKIFTVTAELAPVKGTDLSYVVSEAVKIKDKIHGINITDNQRAIMRSSPLALSRLLVEKGISPICQLTCRDRNRLALQSDLLALSILGVKNILMLTGDTISSGDHPQAKAVFDLDAITLIATAKTLISGKDLAGKDLIGKPNFFIGAAVNPGAEPKELQVLQTVRKIEAGAEFFQTQLIFDKQVLEEFINLFEKEYISAEKLNLLAGIFPLKSSKQARFFNSKIPGVKIPDFIVERLESSADPESEGIEIAWELIKSLRPFIRGVHLMTMGNNRALEKLIDRINLEIIKPNVSG
ncbi:MAG: methylenetetrahydrofolate reductase [bacterium]